MRRAHSQNFPSLHLRHNTFSNPSVALPTSQFIRQTFRHFIYVTTHFPTLQSLYLRHSSFSNPSFASPTWQALHLFNQANRQWFLPLFLIYELWIWRIMVKLIIVKKSNPEFARWQRNHKKKSVCLTKEFLWRMSRAHSYSHSRAHSPTFTSLHLHHN